MRKGFTLVELATALGIVGTLSLVEAQDEQFERAQIQARAMGNEIFQHSAAVGRFLAYHGDTPGGVVNTYVGSDWLHNADCSGSASKEFLSCYSLPEGKTIAHGSVPETTITQAANGGLEARTTWTPVLTDGGEVDSTVMGLAAMVASGAYISKLDDVGASYQGPTVFCPDISAYSPSIDDICDTDANRIVSVVSTNSAVEEWLRVDHGNTMKNFLEFDNGSGEPTSKDDLGLIDDTTVRQIVNVARIYNGGASDTDSIAIGKVHGKTIYTDPFVNNNSLLNNAIILDGDAGIMENLYVRANANIDGDINSDGNIASKGDIKTISGDVISGGNIESRGDISADGDMASRNMLVRENLTVEGETRLYGDMTSDGDIIAKSGVVHSDKGYARVWHDTSELKSDGVPYDFSEGGYILNPNADSRLRRVVFEDVSVFNDYFAINTTDKELVAEGDGCALPAQAPPGSTIISRTARGKLVTCEGSGDDYFWTAPSPEGMVVFFQNSCPDGWRSVTLSNTPEGYKACERK